MEEYPSNINVLFSDFSLKVKEKIKKEHLVLFLLGTISLITCFELPSFFQPGSYCGSKAQGEQGHLESYQQPSLP